MTLTNFKNKVWMAQVFKENSIQLTTNSLYYWITHCVMPLN